MRRLSAEKVALGVFVIVALLLIRDRGWPGVAALLAAGVILGLVFGLIGRRYPMIHSQNRRERRRRGSD